MVYVKNYLCLLACMMATSVQTADAQDYFSSALDYSHLYVGRVEPQYDLAQWQDNPYYKDEVKMMKGRVCYCGVVYENVLLRYDLYKQNLAVCSPKDNVFVLPVQKDIDWFEIDGRKYVHAPEDSTRYAAILCDGSTNGIRLYHSTWKARSEDVSNGDKFLKTLASKDKYTLVTSDGKVQEVSDASDVAKLFPEQAKSIKSFSKKNKLAYNKYVRVVSLPKVISSIEGAPLPKELLSPVSRKPETPKPVVTSNTNTSSQELIAGIPVLDAPTVIEDYHSKQKVYYVAGVKKAKKSIADDHELGEIIVVAGRQSQVNSTTMGSEKFKPELLKNIPSAFGESDIMKIILTLPGVTSVGEASSGYNVRGGASDQNLILFNGGTVLTLLIFSDYLLLSILNLSKM